MERRYKSRMNRALRIAGLFLLFLPAAAFSQVTKIMGTVTDAATGQPIPFVSILLDNTTYGTLTDFDGRYALEVSNPGDSMTVRILGYKTVKQKILKNQFQTINLQLHAENLTLPEVVVKYTGNPAEDILKKVIANKERNSLQSFNTYQYQAYTKIELDANNISEKFKDRKLFKPFGFIWQYIDTSTINGKSYLPVFITESTSDIYFRKSPRARKEVITATRVSGLENENAAQFLGNFSQEVDIYKDFINILEKNFVSPIAGFGLTYYKYYLVDSAFLGNRWCYHIMFKPRRIQELTFTGSMWINDTSWAVKKVDMRLPSDANLNFVNDLAISQDFEYTDDLYWMLSKNVLVADFNIIGNAKKVIGFYAKKTSSYRNFRFDLPETQKFLSVPADVIVKPDAEDKPHNYWDTARFEKLTKSEQGVYNMVDSVKKIPLFNTYVDVINTIVTGYLPWGKFEIGPYSSLYSFNSVEGSRVRLGVRTSPSFSKKIQMEIYGAYGFGDHTFKYGGTLIWLLSKYPRRDLTADYKYDVEQLGTSPTAFASDNILTSIFHRGPNNKLTLARQYHAAYEHEWFPGLINTFHLTHRELFPLGATQFLIHPTANTTDSLSSIFTSEARVDMRLSFREHYVTTTFYRYTVTNDYPVILVTYCYGFPNTFRSDYYYQKLIFNLQQSFNFATIGWSKYIIEAGKIWGTLPYNLLRIHDGNQTFFFDEYASNLMNYYEFVSDQWISAYFTHHFDGLLFNHIPLLRKLKWREVAYVRTVFGTLSEKNRSYSVFPDQLRSFNNIPYWETGVGIENIFRIIRITAIWRLNHLHDEIPVRTSPFSIFVSMNLTF
jgi:hypothetical protein